MVFQVKNKRQPTTFENRPEYAQNIVNKEVVVKWKQDDKTTDLVVAPQMIDNIVIIIATEYKGGNPYSPYYKEILESSEENQKALKEDFDLRRAINLRIKYVKEIIANKEMMLRKHKLTLFGSEPPPITDTPIQIIHARQTYQNSLSEYVKLLDNVIEDDKCFKNDDRQFVIKSTNANSSKLRKQYVNAVQKKMETISKKGEKLINVSMINN